ncbi:hypothetical protein C8A03DRAFT_29769 [Achaetomium macrosporum]|uniref:Uncharacterized protein n=1 Tax=Achaetomium macrosporum TaxID=79813 RepID=A0AAN7HED9_9PEZI|nr:hypothetical protein C8A03DRAFT_29769 [Achaetomium macrosporum]
MPELLLQSALSAFKSKQLAAEAAQIKANCRAQHGETESLVSCPQCYETLLEALRLRYLSPSPATPGATTLPRDQQQRRQQEREWFTSRRAFLSALDLLVDSAKQYEISPQAIDERVREERSRWYADRVRNSLLRLMVEDPAGCGAVFEKLEDLSTPTTVGGGGDPVGLAREVAEILSSGPLAAEQIADDLPEKLAAAQDRAGSVEVLKEAFFNAEDGTVPEDHRKYLDMLTQQDMTMEQVVDRILEERQAAAGAKGQADKLNQRLDELRRARAAHEAQKSRRAQRRESLAQMKVPDELYELPRCAVCGDAPSATDYFCCSICTILSGAGVQQEQTVFCTPTCEEKGHAPHAEKHVCTSSLNCIQAQQNAQPNTTGDGDTHMEEAPPAPSDLRFCTECLTSLKKPTMWCSLVCAEANFQPHIEDVHIPERKNSDAGINGQNDDTNDIRVLTISLAEAVREWEGRNRVRLQGSV